MDIDSLYARSKDIKYYSELKIKSGAIQIIHLDVVGRLISNAKYLENPSYKRKKKYRSD